MEDSLSVRNFIILTVKYYIWKTKFQNKALSLNDYQHYLKNKLEDHKNACFLVGKEKKFEQWLAIFNCLEQICIDANGAPLLPPADQQLAPYPPDLGTPTDHPLTQPTDQGQEHRPDQDTTGQDHHQQQDLDQPQDHSGQVLEPTEQDMATPTHDLEIESDPLL